MLLTWLTQGGPWSYLAAGAALLLALAVLLVLCQGLSLVRARPMLTRMPQRMLLLVGFGAVLAAGALYHTPLAPLAAACAMAWIFGGMMRRSV